MLGSIHSEITPPGASRLIVTGVKVASSLINETEREGARYVAKSIFSSEVPLIKNHVADLADSSGSILQESAENVSKAFQEVSFEPVQIIKSVSLTAANGDVLPPSDPTFANLAHNATALAADSLQASSEVSLIKSHVADLAASSGSILQESAENVSKAFQEMSFEPVQIIKSASLTAANGDFLPPPNPTFANLTHNATALVADSLQTSMIGGSYPGDEPPDDPMGELMFNSSLKGKAESKPFTPSFNGFLTEAPPSSNNLFSRILLGVAVAASAFFLGRFAYKAYQRRRESTEQKPDQLPRVHKVTKKAKTPKQRDFHYQPSTFAPAPLKTFKDPGHPTLFPSNTTSFM